MSHRNALFASIALTLVIALGIFVARDRLFQAEASADSNVTPVATTTLETTGDTQPVIEVTLPQPTPASASRERDDEDEDETRASRTSRQDDEDGDDDEREEDDDD